jgi:diguanylate cyclase (GGDEF)-like protein
MSPAGGGQSTQLALVVDDDPVIRLLAAKALERTGLRVTQASTGEEALLKAAAETPDVVLLDVNMPGIGGFATCARLRQDPKLQYLPILMMTGLEDTDSVSSAYEAGATDFVGKPVHWLLLGHRVRYLLRSAAAFRELSESRARLARSEGLLAAAHRIAKIATWAWDAGTGALRWSPQSERRLGEHVELPATLEEYLRLVHPEDVSLVKRHFRQAIATSAGGRLEHRIVDSLGQVRLIELEFEPIDTNAAGALSGIHGTARDQTERWRAEQRIQHLAYYDVLTGLPNRELFMQQFGKAIAQAAGDATRMGLLFLDLDHFKQINDNHGHGTGDALLRTVAERLRSAMRGRGDGARARDSVARIGGDEFVALVTDVPDHETVMDLARRLLRTLRQPIVLDGQELWVSGSIGIAMYPDDGSDYDLLLRKADAAMYRAKGGGGSGVRMHIQADADDEEQSLPLSAVGAVPGMDVSLAYHDAAS